MSAIDIAGGIIMIIVSILIMVFILLQESKRGGGIEALSMGTSYYSQNEGRTRDAKLHRWTKILAYVFFIVTIAVSAASVYLV
ncbi:MAG: preprotein translocase subunit SecG [Oscillospiraceae bacterium]|nr:preprotein translocase subunit SecG [Oscillospiraceae bacterium]